MDKFTLLAYKNSLLNAGIPYAFVMRNLRELKDHHYDLQQQALASGLGDTAAKAVASQRLGSPDELAAAIIERRELRSKLHSFPIATTVIMPLLMHFAACTLLLIALFFPAISATSESFVDFMRTYPQSTNGAIEALKILLMYVITPVLGCFFAFVAIRGHVPQRFWLTGMILLCLLGSSLIVHLVWPDPAISDSGMIGVFYGVAQGRSYEQQVLTYTVRFAMNLLLCGSFAWYYRRREQFAGISGNSP